MRLRAPILGGLVVMLLALHGAFGSQATIRLELPFGHRPSPPESHNVVLGSDVTFLVSAEEDPLLAVQWQLNGSNIVGETSTNLTLRNVQFTNAGAYQIIGSNTWGSLSSAVISFSVIAPGPLDGWTLRQSNTSNHLYAVTFGNGRFVAVGDQGRVVVSADGITWTERKVPEINYFTSITWGQGLFVAWGDPRFIVTSQDAVEWTRLYFPDYVESLAASQELFVAAGGWYIMSSADAVTWNYTLVDSFSLDAVAYGNSTFVVAGQSKTNRFGLEATVTLTSSNGLDWTSRSSEAATLLGVCHGKGLFVAVGGSFGASAHYGYVQTSRDGLTWASKRLSGYSLNGVAYGSGIFVAIQYGGPMFSSTGGSDWIERRHAPQQYLNGIAYGNGSFVAVGFDGLIIQSDPIVSLDLKTGRFAQLELSGPVGPYRIESSDLMENPTEWRPLTTIDVSETPYVFTDQSSTNAAWRFYRAVSLNR